MEILVALAISGRVAPRSSRSRRRFSPKLPIRRTNSRPKDTAIIGLPTVGVNGKGGLLATEGEGKQRKQRKQRKQGSREKRGFGNRTRVQPSGSRRWARGPE